MKRSCRPAFAAFTFLSLLASTLHGQSLAGIWQGTLREGPHPLRLKFQVTQSGAGRLAAKLWSIDEAGFEFERIDDDRQFFVYSNRTESPAASV